MERTPHLCWRQFICSRGTDMQYSCGPTRVRAYDAVAAAWPASGATSSASATATVADAALCTAAAATTATTSVSSFASASVASSCYAAVAEPATAAHTAA